MIARISGKVVDKEEKSLIIDVGGIGYRVRVGSAVREQAQAGQEITLQTYHQIAEDRQELYGFDSPEEHAYFELLLTVPSVGPRMARNILDVAPPRVLEQAIATEDVSLLTKVSGVGKRTAERLVLELKTKIAMPKRTGGMPGALQQEVVEALVAIGYTPAQARQAVGKLPKDIRSIEDAIKSVLKDQNR